MNGRTDAVYLVYNEFKTAVTAARRRRAAAAGHGRRDLRVRDRGARDAARSTSSTSRRSSALLDALLPLYVESQIYRGLLESIASEFGARMTAMDNATNNAKEMISPSDAAVQPRPSGGDHQGADGDRRRRRGAQRVGRSMDNDT